MKFVTASILRTLDVIKRTAVRGVTIVLTFSGVIARADGNMGEPVWNAFAGRETLTVGLVKERLSAGERVWFRVAKERRTIASGTLRSEKDGHVNVPVQLPEMKPGVALPLEVEIRAGSDQGRILHNGTLWAFAEQPFDVERKLSRRLLLYDPEGHTEKAFRSISLACDILNKPDALEGVTNAVIVLGEGVSLEGERGLADLLGLAVARGNRVLLLAPREGQLKPPSAWRLLLAGNAQDVLRASAQKTASYKLNLTDWPLDGRAVQRRFRLMSERDEAVFIVTPDAGCEAIGWDDNVSGGCLRACGLGIVSKWSEVPAARWLLVELVERLANAE